MFSKAFIEKYGDLLFSELAKRSDKFLHYYRLHSDDKGVSDINQWLQEQASSPAAKAVVESEGWKQFSDNPDVLVRKVLIWVRANIQYKRDQEVHQMPEYWQTVDETLELRTGDCEDGAVLTLLLCYLSGVRASQLILRWGSVVGGGHAYIVYIREYDGLEVILDWCYWFTSIIVKLRKWFHLEKNYLDVWGNARIKNE